MERDELGYWLRLTLTPGIGNEAARKLLAAFGLPDAIFDQPASVLRQVVGATQASNLLVVPTELEAQLELSWTWLQPADEARAARRIVVLGDADYPASLLGIEDPPLCCTCWARSDFYQIALQPLSIKKALLHIW